MLEDFRGGDSAKKLREMKSGDVLPLGKRQLLAAQVVHLDGVAADVDGAEKGGVMPIA